MDESMKKCIISIFNFNDIECLIFEDTQKECFRFFLNDSEFTRVYFKNAVKIREGVFESKNSSDVRFTFS